MAGTRVGRAAGLRPVALAIGLTIISVLPNFLLGALAPEMRAELGFDSAGLGALVTFGHLVAGLSSVSAGKLVERVGPRIGGVAATVLMAALLAGVGFAQSWVQLAVLMAVSGVCQAAAQPAANLVLARQVRVERQGFAFGLKQAAVPSASFLAGMAVPVASLWLGWRATWIGLGVAALLFAAVGQRLLPSLAAGSKGKRGVLPAGRLPSLIILAVAAVFAGAAVVSMSTFMVETAVARGFAHTSAGLLLAGASIGSILTRIVQGWRADRRGGRHLVTVTRMMLVGAAGFATLAGATQWGWFVVGSLVGSSFGWGWNGLLHYSMVHYHRSAPAVAASFTQAGLFFGGAVGPLLFGLMVEHVSNQAAWLGAAGSMVVSAGLVQLGRALLGTAIQRSEADPAGPPVT